jgi:hypothetical protein
MTPPPPPPPLLPEQIVAVGVMVTVTALPERAGYRAQSPVPATVLAPPGTGRARRLIRKLQECLGRPRLGGLFLRNRSPGALPTNGRGSPPIASFVAITNIEKIGRKTDFFSSLLDQPHHNRLHLDTGLDHRNHRRNLNRPMTAPDRGLPVNEGRRSSIPGDRKRTRRCVFPSHPGLVSP